ncbi:hypothetical protein GCM10009789_54100 [Kribbella sancticallisti]|uniref:Uncharacterized protein n=1 Tax=Kribbella sancticallisti TaxID=460087 RepID=A0ABN2E1A6_9ACTN
MGSEKTRQEWRRAVQQSLLPSGVKLTLTKHSESGHGQYHDDAMNEHAIKRDRLAKLCGVFESTVRRQMRRAENAGWLKLHRYGFNGQQQVYHYVTPSSPSTCTDCRTDPRRKGAGKEA